MDEQQRQIAEYPGIKREVAEAIQTKLDEQEATIRLQAQRIRELEAALARARAA